MAELVSPGVSISVSDESFYAAAGTGTVPLLVIATAQDKTAPDGTGTAAYTTSANAGEVKLITSQRELLAQYGNPIFKTSGGTPLHGHELNEYGLQAAYSFMGLANRAYVVRADIDLAELEGSSTAPTVAPASGSYWLDTTNTVWGLKQYNGTTNKWVRQSVTVFTDGRITGTGANAVPKNAFGVDGEFCVIYTDENDVALTKIKFYKKVSGSWVQINTSNFTFELARSTALPQGASDGDLILQMDAANNGTSVVAKVYESGQFVTESVLSYETSADAYAVDATPAVGTLWADYDETTGTVEIKRHNGDVAIVAASVEAVSPVDATNHTSGTVAFTFGINDATPISVTFNGYDTSGNVTLDGMVAAINDAISSANTSVTGDVTGVVATHNNDRIGIYVPTGFDVAFASGNVSGFDLSDINFDLQGDADASLYSNWELLSYEASSSAITGTLTDGKLWYDSLISNTHIDILYNNAGTWTTYNHDVNIAASQPTLQSDGTALEAGDLWIDSGDLENYPQIYKYSGSAWVAVDTADQETEDGVLFADFRSSTSALDSDAPSAALYPYNIIAWNFRLSGGNVKEWDATNERWDNYSGLKSDGTPYMLRKAQRAAVVRAMQSAISSNTDIRNESNRFNLVAAPGYPELADEMITLATDRKETAFVIIDAPLRLGADATSIQAWSNNSNNATETGEDGLVTSYAYSGVYYPHGLTSDLAGNNIVVPASHIALRTLAYNDQVAFPWFAPAGFQRGVVTNASSVGYIDATSGEFKAVSLSEGQRDTLYINKMNPIAQFPGRGLAVFGQKTLSADASALDRVNVARLVVYIRERLDDIVRPFLFEPNDEVTRQNAKVVVDRFLGNLVTQRGLFDFVTVCDTTNNTPARIDRNELHIDIAIQPVKAVEFIYIPIRVQNTLGQTN